LIVLRRFTSSSNLERGIQRYKDILEGLTARFKTNASKLKRGSEK